MVCLFFIVRIVTRVLTTLVNIYEPRRSPQLLIQECFSVFLKMLAKGHMCDYIVYIPCVAFTEQPPLF